MNTPRKDSFDQEQGSVRMNRRGWKAVFAGLLTGLLAAGSASSHVEDIAIPQVMAQQTQSTMLSAPAVERRLKATGGHELRLNREGDALTLWDAQDRLVYRVPLSPRRISASLTLLPSGHVLIWGGRDANGKVQPGGLWFELGSKVVTPADRLTLSPRSGHTATVLSDGRVLFAGGLPDTLPAEVWDERDNRAAPLFEDSRIGRAGHQAQLLASGNVLLSNGVDAAGHVVTQAVVFNVETGRFSKVRNWKEINARLVPGIAGSLPAQGEDTVGVNARLALRFTQAMKPEDLNASTFTLMGPGGSAQLKVYPAEDGRLAFVQPVQALFPDSRYTLMVGGARTATGKPMPLAAIDFKTEALAEPSTGRHEAAEKHRCAETLACRPHSRLRDGVWTPGRDNTENRWRIYSPALEIEPDTKLTELAKTFHVTSLRGRVVRVDQKPVADVEVSIGNDVAKTDAQGWFTLLGVPNGRQELYVDGSTVNRRGEEYGQFVVGVDIERGKLNDLPYVMYLPRITARDKIKIASPLIKDMLLTHPDMPGLTIEIPAGTVVRDRKGKIVTELAIVPTPVNRAPFPVPENYPLYFTLEPGGAIVQGLTPKSAEGIRVTYPNYDGLPKGTLADFWIYNPKDGWHVYGKGQVTQDGKRFAPEVGVALYQMMGGSYRPTLNTQDPPSEEEKPPCSEGCGSVGSGSGAIAGDPINLRTGQFDYHETDIAITDVLPITLERSYRANDTMKRDFGIATAAQFGYKLFIPSFDNSNTLKLTLPNGVPISFTRVSGQGSQGMWRQAGSPTGYSGAVIYLDGGKYQLLFQDGSGLYFDHHSPNRLAWTEDRFGNRVEYIYDAGLVSRIVSPNGRYIVLERDSNNRIKTAKDHTGRTWKYDYDTNGFLFKVTYPDLTFKQYNYRFATLEDTACPAEDTYFVRCNFIAIQKLLGNPINQHAIVSIIDQRGHRLLYNEFEPIPLLPKWIGRVIKQTQADNGVITIDYKHLDDRYPGYGTLVTNPDGSKRRIAFDLDHLYPKVDVVGYGTPEEQVYTFERDSYGRITARIDPLSRRMEYRYNSDGRITGVTALAGTQAAVSMTLTYNNGTGDLETATDHLGRRVRLEYEQGCLSKFVNVLEDSYSFTCNGAGQLTSVTDPLSRTSSLSYDNGELVRVTDPLGRQLAYRYDVLGRQVAVQDPSGNTVRREFDAMDRVIKLYDAKGKATELDYDANGNLEAVLLPNGAGVTYDYDERDRLKTRIDALGKAETWTYDQADRVKTYTDRKQQKTLLDYDAIDRLKTTTYHDGNTVTATYDTANRLRNLADTSTGILSWDYNDFDDITRAVTDQGTITYDYDEVRRRKEMVAGSQPKVEYRYDDADRLRKILQGSEVVSYDYDDADRLTKLTLPNGVKTGYAYNDADQLTGIAWLKADDSPIGDLGYGYDVHGELKSRTGRFVSQNLPPASSGANAFDDNNRQTQYNGNALSYDDNGNLAGDGARAYVWNVRDQLIEVRQGGSAIATFQYDALGRRIGKSEGGQQASYLYDGLNTVQEIRGGIVNPILTGLGTDERYARNDVGGRTYFLTDMLGSTRTLTDANGNVVQRYDYTTYGLTQASASSFSNPYRYTGREQDASGLYYYRARYYQPELGRFISEDSYGFAAGDSNFYGYGLGNPVLYNDPSGHFVQFLLAAWGLVEIGLSIYDLYDTGKTLLDPCASGSEKSMAAGLLLLGMALPGGGYSKADDIARITPGSLPALEEKNLLEILEHIDNGTKPIGDLAKKWGKQFKNWAGDLPGPSGNSSPYLEYRVAPSLGQKGAGINRVVVNSQTGEAYYTWTHYGDTGMPPFVQIR